MSSHGMEACQFCKKMVLVRKVAGKRELRSAVVGLFLSPGKAEPLRSDVD